VQEVNAAMGEVKIFSRESLKKPKKKGSSKKFLVNQKHLSPKEDRQRRKALNRLPERKVRKIEYVKRDLVVNNGHLVSKRAGQYGLITQVDRRRQVVTVVGPEGIVEWRFLEIDHCSQVEGDREAID